MINRFVLNEVSYFGPGAREVLPKEVKRLGLHKAFVATDKDLIKFGVADKVLNVLKEAGIPYEIFSDIKPNPTVANVKAGVKAFAESGADFILWRFVHRHIESDRNYYQQPRIQRCRFSRRRS